MTGGAGFARAGQDSFRDNRKLRNNRTLLKDNPFAGGNAKGHRQPQSAQEAQEWRTQKHHKAQQLRLMIFGILLPLVLLLALLFGLIN